MPAMANIGDGWTYQLRYVRCGRPNCRPCSIGFGHGPYWYAYQRQGGRVRSRYVGKNLPADAFAKAPAPEPEIDQRWVFRGRMDGKTALRILGFTSYPDQATLSKRWRQLVYLHHPDHGGDVRICAAINVAYGYLRK